MQNRDRIFVVDEIHGINSPKVFASYFPDDIPEDTKECLSSPDNPDYWEAWDELVSTFTVVVSGIRYAIELDEGVWLTAVQE